MEEFDVSIVIPVYGVEKYIERCLNSVMRQDSKSMSLECILVDDCSPDGSIKIAEKMIMDYSGGIRFEILRHEKNQGLSVARNTGMRSAKGRFLFFIDSDDYITDDCIMNLYKKTRDFSDVEVVKGNHVGRIAINVSRIPSCPLNNDTLLNLLYMSVVPVMAWNTLIKRDVIQNNNLAFKPRLLYEDNLWSAQLFRHVKSFLFVPDTTYYYESNNTSITGNGDAAIQAKALPHFIIMVDNLINSYDKQHFITYTFFIISRLMQMVDLILKDQNIDSNLVEIVLKQRNQLLRYTFQNRRFVLVLFELLLYFPLWNLMRFRLFRRYYDRVVIVVYRIALFFDFVHK